MSQLLVLSLLGFVNVLFGAHCHDTNPVFGPTNDFPIYEGNPNMQFINQVKNGKLYSINVPNSGAGTNSSFYVVHVWGSAYEMGVAQGTLLKDTLVPFFDNVWNYLRSQIESGAIIKDMPKWLADMIADVGLDAALEATELLTREYTSQDYYDEISGLADATGYEYQTIVNVHMVAGLTQGHCSMFGLWGQSLNPNSPAKLLQMRALDWDMDGPFRDVPALTIYHPNPGQGNTHALVGMAGFIGGLTGMSDRQLGISEIGVSYPDDSFGSQSRIGIPFIFLLRDILKWDQSVDDATTRMTNAKRTCDLILGVGDGKMGKFRGYQYSSSVLNVFDDTNLMPLADWHPRINDTVYWGMDWLCPGDNEVLGKQLETFYGQMNPQVAVKNIGSVEQSGDNHLAIYDLTNLELYVSYAAPHNGQGPAAAYDRQFTHISLKPLFAEQPPQ